MARIRIKCSLGKNQECLKQQFWETLLFRILILSINPETPRYLTNLTSKSREGIKLPS